MSYSSEVLADSPLTYLRLGEGSGTTATDASGNGRHGTYGGSPTLGQTGALTGDADTAVLFDGVDDRVSVALDLSAVNTLTIECWLNWTTFANNDKLLGEFTTNFNSTLGGILLDPNESGTGRFQAAFQLAASFTPVHAEFTRPTAGAYHHVVIELDRTVDAASGAVRMWYDKVEQTAVTKGGSVAGGFFANSTFYLMSRAGSSLFAAGKLDEFAIYSTLLSQTRIAAHYDVGVTGPGAATSFPLVRRAHSGLVMR